MQWRISTYFLFYKDISFYTGETYLNAGRIVFIDNMATPEDEGNPESHQEGLDCGDS